MIKRYAVPILCCIAVALCNTASAATVASSGATLDLNPDIDVTSATLGQGVLGTLFWDYENGSSTPNPPNAQAPQADRQADDFVGNQRNNLPSYITAGPGAELQGVSGGWGYQRVIDDFGPSFESGVLAAADGGGELATLTLEAGVPDSLRLGVVMDNLDGTAFVGTDLTIEIGGSSASLDPSVNANQQADIYWYDLSGLVAGDVISVQSGASPNDFGTVAGFVVVPEPSTILLAGVTLVGGLLLRRRVR